MVLLTMSSAIADSLQRVQDLRSQSNPQVLEERLSSETNEPSLSSPAVGRPISHDQIISLSKELKRLESSPFSLDTLLQGLRIYVPPPPPKPEPTPEYKALMARLRREEEAREYERMINPPPPTETFTSRFPSRSAAHAFTSTAAYQSLNAAPEDEKDEMTYSDVNRQVILIINVLVSIVASAAALWMVSRWWSTAARLALSLGGTIAVAIAEVGIYAAYIRRLEQAKNKEKATVEVRDLVKTWVVGSDTAAHDGQSKEAIMPIREMSTANSNTVRKRRKEKDTN